MLVIEHDMPLISGVADHLVALDHGQVVVHGLPADVLHDPRVVESYLGTSGDELAVVGSRNGSRVTAARRRKAPVKKAAVKKAAVKKAAVKKA